MNRNSFATAIMCIDGRAHRPVREWLQQEFGAEHIDRVTEPGPDKVLADGVPELTEAIRRKVRLSIVAHQSVAIAVAGHHDCAANPVSVEEHHVQIIEAVKRICSRNLGVPVFGLWVTGEWEVEVVANGNG